MQKTNWLDMHHEYKKSLHSIKEYKENKKVMTVADQVYITIASEIVNSLVEVTKQIKNKILYEYSSISKDDIENPIYSLTVGLSILFFRFLKF